MKGSSSDFAIFSSSSTEMHHFVMDYRSKALETVNVLGISIPANYRNDFGVNL